MFSKGKLTILLVFVALVLTAFSGVVVADEHENGEDSENVTEIEPVEFDEQELDDEGAVEVVLSNETLEDAEYVLLTYMQDEDEVAGDAEEVVAGIYELGENDTEVSVEVEDDGGYPGEHTAYAVSGLSLGGYDAGDIGLSSATSDNVIAYDYAQVLQEVDDEEDDDEEEAEVPRVVFEDQTTEGDSVVVADSACMSQDYVIVIHEDDDGEPGDAIGHESVEQGENTDTTVDLDETLEEGDHTLYAMLHEEAEDDDYGPSLERDGETVVDDAIVTVEAEEDEEDDDEEMDDEEMDDEEVDDEDVDDGDDEEA